MVFDPEKEFPRKVTKDDWSILIHVNKATFKEYIPGKVHVKVIGVRSMIEKHMKEHPGPHSTKELYKMFEANNKTIWVQLNNLIREGKVEKIRHGWYQWIG